ncbi:hypothetical protein Tco_1524069 [Tanacetum coccineum]
MDLEACSSEAANLDTSRILFTLESIKSSTGDDENTLKSSSSVPGFDSYDSPKSDPEETQDTKTVENSVKSTSNSMSMELEFLEYLCGGGEGMETLWEAYEEDTTNKISRSSKKKKNVKNNKSKSEFKYFDDGKMKFGHGDPNLERVLNALKASMYNESARTKAQEQQDEPLFEG